MNSVADIWKMVVERMKVELSETTISTWFDETSAVSMDGTNFYLSCPNDFKRSTIETLYIKHIQAGLRDIFSSDFTVTFIAVQPSDDDMFARRSVPAVESGNYTFDNFVVGECNKLAHAAARAVAEKPGEYYNPLFIYGDSGLGKTHLIYAIRDEIVRRNPSAKVVYIKGEEFTNELINAIREHKNEEFRNKYRDADLLLMDDVQFVAGRTQTQEEFFHTFNKLHESHRQIVLTSDRPPTDMSHLEDRLRTRFEGGLLVDVQPPELETRVAIIKSKAMQRGTVITDELALYIAENVFSNVRQLECATNKIVAYSEMFGRDLDKETADKAIRDLLRKSSEYVPTAAAIISEVARYFGLEESVVKGPSRSRNPVNARQIAMYLIRTMTSLSTPDIGRAFQGRDHTTVLHALDQVEKKLKTDKELADAIRDISMNINERRNKSVFS